MEKFREILLQEKEKIEQDLRTRYELSTDNDRDVGDEVDFSVVEQERELNLLLKDREKIRLEAIEEALQRIETGEYGFCEECGEQILHKRLLVMPLAQFCISCQQNFEKSGAFFSSTRLPQQNYTIKDE